MSQVGVYSFTDTQASITGPGGSVIIGSGAGNAKEGITVQLTEDKDRLVIGADGSSMHSLIAGNSGKIIVRLLKTSPTNALLTALFNFQKQSSAFFGKNILKITNPVTGDDYTCSAVAFTKFPNNGYAEEAGLLEWDFNAGNIIAVLGTGLL